MTALQPNSSAANLMNDYYVYVYLDSRNHEEFYYGKGVGSRKDAHQQSDAAAMILAAEEMLTVL